MISLKKFIYTIFLLFSHLIRAYEYDLTVCCIFQDEAPYLKEWIDYHRKLGVDHFILYNNSSTDDWEKVLHKYIKKGVVEVVDWPNLWPDLFFGYHCQPYAYKDCISKMLGKTEWLAIIDTDEFIIPMQDKNLKKCLKNHYSIASAIFVNWLQFGTSGIHLPEGYPILPYLTKCSDRSHEWNKIGKTIIRPEAFHDMGDPHFCILKPGFEYSDGDGWHHGYDWKHHEALIRINHYTFRDENCLWNRKAPRWKFTKEEMIKKNQEYCVSEDTFIFRFINVKSSARHLE